MEKMAIVIVNWNTSDLLAKCLVSLERVRDREVIEQVIVVDNNSHDDSVARAQAAVVGRIPITWQLRDDNLGFAGGNNAALQEMSTDAHVFLLNPDTEVHDGALTALLQVLRAKPRAGIVGPKLRNADGTVQPSVRPFPTLGTFALWMVKLGRFIRLPHYDVDQLQQVDQVMGAAFLIRNETRREIGDLDDGFFVWFEEVDYCRRAVSRGWEVWYTPAGEITHHGGASFSQLTGLKKSWPFVKSALRYVHKHYGMLASALLSLLTPLTVLLSLPATAVHRLQQRGLVKRIAG